MRCDPHACTTRHTMLLQYDYYVLNAENYFIKKKKIHVSICGKKKVQFTLLTYCNNLTKWLRRMQFFKENIVFTQNSRDAIFVEAKIYTTILFINIDHLKCNMWICGAYLLCTLYNVQCTLYIVNNLHESLVKYQILCAHIMVCFVFQIVRHSHTDRCHPLLNVAESGLAFDFLQLEITKKCIKVLICKWNILRALTYAQITRAAAKAQRSLHRFFPEFGTTRKSQHGHTN